ncbi:uncharacterized protein BDCG_16327 [Blastomyces dermatitidis ER-3]|uniref:Uncharacterized protein n=1 Tax=Ajellomyces dermatitidis (strain ER-3 / ATCC MYA-2586) TaxID=559297 RepID=A0ABP2ERD9_AJEDR|nr:uncharacterized protein BDCG_16327 [Blastomyces dermatitidis ER-3]EEQ84537.2 hypothetical protein BDCG_16327 [Blastomyces dermatitidis ER-3]
MKKLQDSADSTQQHSEQGSGSYTTVLTGGGGGVATAAGGAEDETDMDKLISRRDDISLQGMVTTAAAAKEAGEEEDMTIRAVLLWLIDAAVSVFNLAFLAATEAAAASQRCLLTRKYQNKSSTVL